jgi:hypothetical protein
VRVRKRKYAHTERRKRPQTRSPFDERVKK